MKLHGGVMELVMPQGGDGKPQTVLVTKGVKLTSDDGLEVTSDQANYDKRTAVVTIPGAVQFTKGRLTGSGVGATYDQNRNVLWLLDQAKLIVKADATGAGAAEATAKGIGMARNEHFVRLVENAHIVGEGRTLDANEIVLQLLPDDSTLQSVAMRGNSRITGSGGASGANAMSAPRHRPDLCARRPHSANGKARGERGRRIHGGRRRAQGLRRDDRPHHGPRWIDDHRPRRQPERRARSSRRR